jgi:hypothetical protein
MFFATLLPQLPTVSGREHTVTFVKCLPNGQREVFEQKILIQPGEKLSASIATTCEDIFDDDERFRDYADAETGLFWIVSGGDGLHLALPPSGKYSRFLEMYWALIPSIIYCHFNEGASTDITSLIGGTETTLADAHRLLCVGFVGVLGWGNVFSFYETGLAGLAPYVWSQQD